MRVREHEKLRDEFDVEQAAARRASGPKGPRRPSRCAISARISRTSLASLARSRAARSVCGDDVGDLRGETRVAGDDARARQRHVLPGLGLLALIEREGRRIASRAGPCGPEGRSRRSTS